MAEFKQYDQIATDIVDRIIQANVGITNNGRTSVVRSIVDAIAFEMDIQNYMIEGAYDKFDTNNLNDNELDERVGNIAVYRKAGTYTIGTVTFGRSLPSSKVIQIPVGTLVDTQIDVNNNVIQFITIAHGEIQIGQTTVDIPVKCTEVGYRYLAVGSLVVMPDPLVGIEYVTNNSIIDGGTDIEDDDSLRERYYEKLHTPATSGNIYHYINWAKSVAGVGDAGVVPLWNGNGTVKVIITDDNKKQADTILIQSVTDYIESVRPIGATVTVVSATEVNTAITANVAIKAGYTIEQVIQTFADNIDEFRRGIPNSIKYISHASIGNILYNTEGIADYNSLLLNGFADSITLNNDEIPVFTTTLEVIV